MLFKVSRIITVGGMIGRSTLPSFVYLNLIIGIKLTWVIWVTPVFPFLFSFYFNSSIFMN